MKTVKLIFSIFLLLCFNSSFPFAQNWEWAVGGKGYDNFDYSNNVVVDNTGNVYIAGYFTSPSLSFGTKKIDNLGLEDIFVAKFDTKGNCLWNVGFGGSENDRATAMTLLGNFLIVAGYFESKSANFGNFFASPRAGSDVFVAILNTNDGSVLQLKTFGGDGYDEPNYVFLDQNNNLYICGEFSGDYLIFGVDTIKNYNYGSIYKGMSDGFIVKFASDGSPLWGKAYGQVANDRVNACVVDSEAMMYIYGTFNSNRIVFSDTLVNKGYSDIFLAKYDQTQGKYLWQMEISGTDKDYPASILLGNDGYIYITGEFQSEVLQFRGISLPNNGSYDFFIIKLDKNGNVVKARSFGSYSDEYAKKIVQDKDGSLYIGGYFASLTLTLDTLTATNSGTDAFSDIFVAKLDADLNPIWVQTAGGQGEDQSFAIAVEANGNVYQTGNFASKEILFNKTSVFNFGYSNVFLAKLSPNLPLEIQQNQEIIDKLFVYPNPFSEFVQIIPFDTSLPSECELFDSLGELLFKFQLSGPTKLDLRTLTSGVYFLKFKNQILILQKE